MNGAKALIRSLEKEDVNTIFGIPGGALIPIYDALYESGMKHVLMRHEQCAAHAAEGYARASGRVGVCMATSGPGATNLVTGIANAYMDSSPIVAFTGQVNTKSENTSYMIGRDAFQEADIIGITTPITKFNFQVRNSDDIPKTVKEAFYIASSGRPGPVLIDLPKDIQENEIGIDFDDDITFPGYRPNINPHLRQIAKAANLLINSETPVIIAGGGVISSGASNQLIRLAELLGAPVATTFMGKGCIPEDHLLSLGTTGMHGTIPSNKMVPEADVLLAVGMRFSDRTTGSLKEFCQGKIIHIDIDSSEIGKNIKATIPIVADAKQALIALISNLEKSYKKKKRSIWMTKLQTLKKDQEDLVKENKDLSPPKILKGLRKIIPREAIICTEVGQNQMWAALYLKAYKPRTFISSGGLGTMGFGFPASIGAKVACPEVPVLDIAGDGSFIMTSQDLAASVMSNIPVIVVILNNSVLGMVAQWQRLFYGKRYSGISLGSLPDFVKLADAYGAEGIRVNSSEELESAVKNAIGSNITTVIDVPISSEENVFPMVPPGGEISKVISGE